MPARRLELDFAARISLAAIGLLAIAFVLLPWVNVQTNIRVISASFSATGLELATGSLEAAESINLYAVINANQRNLNLAGLRELIPPGADRVPLAELVDALDSGLITLADILREVPAGIDLAAFPVTTLPLVLMMIAALASGGALVLGSSRLALALALGALAALSWFVFGGRQSGVIGGAGLLLGGAAISALVLSRIDWGPRAVNALTVIVSLIFLAPLIFSILMSLRPETIPLVEGNILFGCGTRQPPTNSLTIGTCTVTLANYQSAWSVAPWPRHYLNTIIFAAGTLAVQLITVTMAAYAFARMRFPGRDLLLIVVLLQLMIPAGVLIIPNFVTIRELGVFDTYIALMLPYWGSAFGVLLLRQTFREVPYELEEAARIDGANWFQIMRNVYIPLSIPAYLSFALVSISSRWTEFLWPFIVTRTEEIRPLTVGLNKLYQATDSGASYNQLMAGTVLVIAPLVVLFILFQRRFLESFARSGLK
jgi:sn-glycerol 3-phosphate transport system permease protein